MKVEYPDLYQKTDCGDGLMRYTDNGHTYFQQDGKDMKWCKRCGNLDFEDKMSWDDLCTNCQEHDRTCWHCGDMFAEELSKDDDGYRICPDCKAINEELDAIKEVSDKSHELYKRGVLSINPFNNTVHLTPKAFTGMFTKYAVIPRETEQFPAQIEAEVEGLKFFALLTPEEQAKLKEAV